MTKPISPLDLVSGYFNVINEQVRDNKTYWKSHQDKLQSMYNKVKHLSSESKNALIVGAGNCNDIPLSLIVDDYETTTLLDIDIQSIGMAKKQLNTLQQSKVQLIQQDITSIFKEYALQITQNLMIGNYVAIEKLLKDIKHNRIQICSKKLSTKINYDLIISSTVSTQLVSTLLEPLISRFSPNFLSIVKNTLYDVVNIASQHHVKQILDSLSDNGIAIITSEQYQWGEQSLLTAYIKSPEDMLDAQSQQQIELKNNIIIGRIKEQMLPANNIVNRDQWIWRFNENRYYLVKGWIIKK